MPSSLAWIDFDESERQRTQKILALFNERESRDELGLGAVRDSIADHLFPGTSTIQTRLRYMLFVPWIFKAVEAKQGEPDELLAEARRLQISLISALQRGGETTGVIGRTAGVELQRLPSSIYWSGLESWGIRVLPVSIETYLGLIGRRQGGIERIKLGGWSANTNHAKSMWHPNLPAAPDYFFESTNFRLTENEAGFILDRLVLSHPKALMTKLARDRLSGDCDFIWEHPLLAEFPSEARKLVGHAEVFSGLLHGASLLYNLQLSELREHDEWVGYYQERFKKWQEELDREKLESWALQDFWSSVQHPAHNIHPRTMRFISEWLALITNTQKGLAQSLQARNLIRDRESRLKGAQSRFRNRSALDRWGGASGTEQLSFRWPQAKSYLWDIENAE